MFRLKLLGIARQVFRVTMAKEKFNLFALIRARVYRKRGMDYESISNKTGISIKALQRFGIY